MGTLNQMLRARIGSSFGADVVEQNIQKSIKAAQLAAKTGSGPVTQFYDPYALFLGREWLVKAGTPLTFQDLRAMAKNPIVGSIIHTRLNQVAAFCRPTQGYEYGYKIVQKGVTDKAKTDKSSQVALEAYLSTMGEPKHGDASLEEFARKFIRDSLILDQACAEIVPRQNKLPSYAVAVDAATIRRLLSSMAYVPNESDPLYVQVLDEVMVAQYTQAQMIFGIRNPTTDIRMNGYGQSELELLISTITTLANAEKYNSMSLQQGGTQKGVMVVKGDVDQPQLDQFKLDFRLAVQNASTQWRPPVLRVGPEADVTWLPIDRSQKDMEYGQLFEFIVKLATGVYQISPAEINWTIGQANRIPFSSGADQKDILDFSRDKGLKPLLGFFADQLNTHLIEPIDPRFEMRFEGLGWSRAEEADLRGKEVRSYKTVNEVRSDAELPPILLGDVILDSNMIQLYMKVLQGGDTTPAPEPIEGQATQTKDAPIDPKRVKELSADTPDVKPAKANGAAEKIKSPEGTDSKAKQDALAKVMIGWADHT